MGKNYVENSLKRFLKRKVKITLALITVFLITGSIGYGAFDETLITERKEINGGTYENIYGKEDLNEGKDAVNPAIANNSELILNGVISTNIYGGFAENNNTSSEETNGDANALNNSIEISNVNGDIKYIYGGRAVSSGTGDLGSAYANKNSIIIKKLTVEDGKDIIGGYAQSYGASSKNIQASNNNVEINDNSIIASNIYGGYIWTQSNGNPSTKSNGKEYTTNIKEAIIESNNNSILITNSQIGTEQNKKEIRGSYIDADSIGNTAESIKNIVSLANNSTMYGDIYGAYIRTSGNSTGNSKSSGINIVSLVEGNQVNIDSSRVYGDVVGARVFEQDNNKKARYGYEGEVEGIKNILKENLISIKNNSNISGSLYGVYAESIAKTTTGNVSISKMSSIEILGNNLTIDTSRIGTKEAVNIITGGYGISSAGGMYKEAGDIILKKNSVTIKNSEVYADICGVYGKSTGGYKSNFGGGDANSGNVSAIGNQVIIDGGTINGDIYGAYIETEVVKVNGLSGTKGALKAENNVITIKGNSKLENSNLYGSNLKNNETRGNKLVIDNWSGKVNSINNFNSVEFKNINWQNEGTVLEITKGENGLKNTDVGLISMTGKVNVGDSMYFVKSSENLGTDENRVTSDKDFTLGLGLQGSGELIVEENGNILYKIGDVGTSEQVNLLAENRAVSLAFVNQGGDLIKQALNTMEIDTNYGFKSFLATQGNHSKYDVDSDIKINGWSIVAGLGKTDKLFDKKLDWAVFYENGIGNYRTYNNFNQERFNGSGELEYQGGGIASRYHYSDDFSIESSIRVGNLSTEMDNALMNSNKNMYDFDFDTLYYSFHVGVNKNIKLSENRALDIYSRYSYTYTDEDDINLENQKFKFDSAESSRFDLGIRINESRYNNINLYYGLAFEYEFDGKADMSIDDYSAPTQSLKGDTYMAELGLKYESAESPWSYDINVHGYTGEREGVTGTLNVTYKF